MPVTWPLPITAAAGYSDNENVMNGFCDYGCTLPKTAKSRRRPKRTVRKEPRATASGRKTVKATGFGEGTVLDRRWTKLL